MIKPWFIHAVEYSQHLQWMNQKEPRLACQSGDVSMHEVLSEDKQSDMVIVMPWVY